MIGLFFLVVGIEVVVAFLLMVKIGPLRELVMQGLDQVKMRRGTVKPVAGTIFAILASNLFSILKISNKGAKHGTLTPMDQVLWRTNLLQVTLMGMVSCHLIRSNDVFLVSDFRNSCVLVLYDD